MKKKKEKQEEWKSDSKCIRCCWEHEQTFGWMYKYDNNNVVVAIFVDKLSFSLILSIQAAMLVREWFSFRGEEPKLA